MPDLMPENRDLPPPDPDQIILHLRHLGPGGLLYRMLPSQYSANPLGWVASPSRFSDPRIGQGGHTPYGVLYLATKFEGAFLESIVRDNGLGHAGEVVPFGTTRLDDKSVAEVRLQERLKLVDMRGEGPVRMRIPTDAVRARDHQLGQIWSQAIHAHHEAVDGIVYTSRLNEDLCNIALYDRAIHKISCEGVFGLHDYSQAISELNRKYALEFP